MLQLIIEKRNYTSLVKAGRVCRARLVIVSLWFRHSWRSVPNFSLYTSGVCYGALDLFKWKDPCVMCVCVGGYCSRNTATSFLPSIHPSFHPSVHLSFLPSFRPSLLLSFLPSVFPSFLPSVLLILPKVDGGHPGRGHKVDGDTLNGCQPESDMNFIFFHLPQWLVIFV